MVISSPVFENNEKIPQDYTCDGQGINPPLLFLDVPDYAVSLVLIVDDPDAVIGTFTHWVVYNIDPHTREVLEDSVPAGGVQGRSDDGQGHYVPPCPPSGEHRYFFKLYALTKTLSLSPGAKKEEVEEAMKGHILDYSEMVGLYSRG